MNAITKGGRGKDGQKDETRRERMTEEGPTAMSRFMPSILSRSWEEDSKAERALVVFGSESAVDSKRSREEPVKVRSRVDS